MQVTKSYVWWGIALTAIYLLCGACLAQGEVSDAIRPAEKQMFIAASDDRIEFTGRVLKLSNPQHDNDTEVIFDWPCVSLKLRVNGTSAVHVLMNGGNNEFYVLLNGTIFKRIRTSDEQQLYTLAIGLPIDSVHHFEMYKLTEATYFGLRPLLPLYLAKIKGFILNGNKAEVLAISPESRLKHKIEIIGDSNSNGFGIDGPDHWECFFHFLEYENCYQSWGENLARLLNAQVHMEAWTGMGVVKNAVGFTRETDYAMPYYLNRTLATEHKHPWDFSQWVPELVLVMLGCNDYFAWPYPTDAEFVAGYVRMLDQIYSMYNFTKRGVDTTPVIISICGGHVANNRAPCANIQAAHRAVQAARGVQWTKRYLHYVEIQRDWLSYPADFACLDHRNVKGQQKLAAHLAPIVTSIMQCKTRKMARSSWLPQTTWSNFVTVSITGICTVLGVITFVIGFALTVVEKDPVWFMDMALPGMFFLLTGIALILLLCHDCWKMRHHFKLTYRTMGKGKNAYLPPVMDNDGEGAL